MSKYGGNQNKFYFMSPHIKVVESNSSYKLFHFHFLILRI